MWVEVARPGQGNLGWLLEGGRGEILLPVEEREKQPTSEARLHRTLVPTPFSLFSGNAFIVSAPHHASGPLHSMLLQFLEHFPQEFPR